MEFQGRYRGQINGTLPVGWKTLKSEFCETIKVYFPNIVERKMDQLILLIIGKQ